MQGNCSPGVETLAAWKESYGKPGQCSKKQRQHIADKDPYSQSYVVMYGCESWTIGRLNEY